MPFSIQTLSRGSLGAPLGGLGAILGGLEAVLGTLGAILGDLGAVLGGHRAIQKSIRNRAGSRRKKNALELRLPRFQSIDPKIDPKIIPKSSRIRDRQNRSGATPAEVSEKSIRKSIRNQAGSWDGKNALELRLPMFQRCRKPNGT